MFVSIPPQGQRCCRCHELKTASEFAWRRRALGELDTYCRPCRAAYKRVHYAANCQRYIAAATRRKAMLRAERTALLIEFFQEHPCADCGQCDPVILEFDHIGRKEFTIGRAMVDRNWSAILDEISRCEVVCANCHRRRTALRGGFARVAAAEAAARPSSIKGAYE
jgi:hypothetical protein